MLKCIWGWNHTNIYTVYDVKNPEKVAYHWTAACIYNCIRTNTALLGWSAAYVLRHPPHDTTQLIIMLVRSDFLVSFNRKSCTQLSMYECKGESGHIWAECSGCTTRPRFLTPTPMNASLYYPCDSSSGLPQCGKQCVQSLSRQQDVTDAADACPEPHRLGSLKSHSFSFAVIQLFIFWLCTMFLLIAFFMLLIRCCFRLFSLLFSWLRL